MPTATELADGEPDISEAALPAVERLWETLGLTVEELPDGTDFVHVSDPTWAD